MARLSAYAAFALALATLSPSTQAALILSPSDGTTISGTSLIVQADNSTGDEEFSYCVGFERGSCDLYFSPYILDTSIVVSDVPQTGEVVYIRLYSRPFGQNNTVDFSTVYASSLGGTGTVSGEVTLAPDQSLSVDSGLTAEQFSRLAEALLMTLVVAICIRYVIKAAA